MHDDHAVAQGRGLAFDGVGERGAPGAVAGFFSGVLDFGGVAGAGGLPEVVVGVGGALVAGDGAAFVDQGGVAIDAPGG